MTTTAGEAARRIVVALDQITSDAVQSGLMQRSHDAQIDQFTKELTAIIQQVLDEQEQRIRGFVDTAAEGFDARFSGILTVQRVSGELLKARSGQELDEIAKTIPWKGIANEEIRVLRLVGQYCRDVLPERKIQAVASSELYQGQLRTEEPDF